MFVVLHHAPTLRSMDEGARAAVVHSLVRDSNAVPESIEMLRDRRVGGRVTAVARWTEARTGSAAPRRVDVVMEAGRWRAGGGWSATPTTTPATWSGGLGEPPHARHLPPLAGGL